MEIEGIGIWIAITVTISIGIAAVYTGFIMTFTDLPFKIINYLKLDHFFDDK